MTNCTPNQPCNNCDFCGELDKLFSEVYSNVMKLEPRGGMLGFLGIKKPIKNENIYSFDLQEARKALDFLTQSGNLKSFNTIGSADVFDAGNYSHRPKPNRPKVDTDYIRFIYENLNAIGIEYLTQKAFHVFRALNIELCKTHRLSIVKYGNTIQMSGTLGKAVFAIAISEDYSSLTFQRNEIVDFENEIIKKDHEFVELFNSLICDEDQLPRPLPYMETEKADKYESNFAHRLARIDNSELGESYSEIKYEALKVLKLFSFNLGDRAYQTEISSQICPSKNNYLKICYTPNVGELQVLIDEDSLYIYYVSYQGLLFERAYNREDDFKTKLNSILQEIKEQSP